MTSREQDIKIIEETKMLVELFLKTNASDIELSKMTGISSSTVGRRLTNKGYITKAFFENGEELYETIKNKRQENLLKGKALGGQTTLLNHVYAKDEAGKFNGSTKIRLDVIYQKKENQQRFLTHLALYFRLHLDTLSILFQIDENELHDMLYENATNSKFSLDYLFNYDNRNQDLARESFLSYYRELLNAIREKNLEERKRLINEVCDVKAIEFKKNRQLGSKIKKEDIRTLINYQLKYSISIYSLCIMFDIDEENYRKRVNNYLQDKPDLQKEFEDLLAFGQHMYRESKKNHG